MRHRWLNSREAVHVPPPCVVEIFSVGGNACMKNRVVILIVMVVASLVFFGCSDFRKAKLVAEDSAQRSLLAETERLLDTHHAARKSYPHSLTELQFTNWPDGSSPKTLLTFHYNSRGTSYVLTCTSVWTGKVFVVQK